MKTDLNRTGAARLAVMAALAIGAGSPADAARRASGEVWVYPVMFEQTLGPLAPLAGKVVREGSCPSLRTDEAGVLHTYQVDVQMKVRRFGEELPELTNLRLVNPTGCAVLDAEVTKILTAGAARFSTPRKDLNGDGWTRLPNIRLVVPE